MKDVLTQAMQQDFSSHAVLGRVLYGVSFLVLGLYSIINAGSLDSYAPNIVPDFLASLAVLTVGAVFVFGGFGVATGKCVTRGATAIAVVWAVLAVCTNLLNTYFDVRDFFVALAFIGASMMIKSGAEDTQSAAPEAVPETPMEQERHHDSVPHEHR